MADPARRSAEYTDVLNAPPNVVAEVVYGVLYQSPRPAPRHLAAASAIGSDIYQAFQRGRGGPGGWIILDEPELHLGPDIIVPDIAGWRRSTMPELPVEDAFFSVRPDWACEVASPRTRALDRGPKLEVYQRERVPHLWFVEPLDRFLEVLELDGETYRLVQRASGDEPARLRPFDAIEFDVAALWAR